MSQREISSNGRWPSIYTVMAVAVLVAGTTLLQAEEGDVAGARELVDNLQNHIIEVMKVGQEVGFGGRYEKFDPVIRDAYRMSTIARLTTGRYWGDIEAEKKEEFEEHLATYVVSSYAEKFKKYKGEYFEFASVREYKPGQVLVETDLYLDDGDTIRFKYVLSDRGGKWEIINVMVKGISDLALRRAEFTSIIEKDGFDVLLVKVADKVKEIRAKVEEEEAGLAVETAG